MVARVAAGLKQNDALLAEGMAILGWSERGTHQRLTPLAAFGAARDTWAVFRRLGVVPKSRRAADGVPVDAARRLARAALVGRPTPLSVSVPVAPTRRSPESAVQLRVTLRDIEPEIWRRMVAPASLTLLQLHGVLQTAMG